MGKTALIRTHENEIDCRFAEIDRENLYYNFKQGNIVLVMKTTFNQELTPSVQVFQRQWNILFPICYDR